MDSMLYSIIIGGLFANLLLAYLDKDSASQYGYCALMLAIYLTIGVIGDTYFGG